MGKSNVDKLRISAIILLNKNVTIILAEPSSVHTLLQNLQKTYNKLVLFVQCIMCNFCKKKYYYLETNHFQTSVYLNNVFYRLCRE